MKAYCSLVVESASHVAWVEEEAVAWIQSKIEDVAVRSSTMKADRALPEAPAF